MKFKLDEHLGLSIQALFRERQLDCATAREENLGGAEDSQILAAAVAEQRVLVTTDHDFGNVFVYPPGDTCGIVVLNVPGRVTRRLLHRLVRAMLDVASPARLHGRLWIVEPGRIREHE